MSRLFHGGTALEYIAFAIGNGPINQGGITMAALVQANASNFTGNAINGYDAGGFTKFGLLAAATGPSRMFVANDFGNGGPIVGTNWCWMVSTHPSGGGVPRHHRYDFTAGTWQHVDGTANVPDLGGTAATILLGNTTGGTASDGWRGWMAAAALFKTALSDAAVEAAFTLRARDLAAASPDWAVLLNQTSTATTVTDFTGGHGDQTSISGTSVDTATDPPGFDYTLPSAGLAVTVWNGTAEVAASVTVWNGTAEVAASVASVV